MVSCKVGDQIAGFTCTGYDGKNIWKKIHAIPKEIECQNCSDHADLEFKGLHDHVNLGLRKEAFDKNTYNEWYEEVKAVHDACKKDGRC